jgi:hypothetical protein
MNNYLAITPPKWRDSAAKKMLTASISPNTRQSGEIEEWNMKFTNKGINKSIIVTIEGVIGGITEEIKRGNRVLIS